MIDFFACQWRTGRKLGRTIYAQAGAKPSEDDPLLGMLDTRDLAAHVVAVHNATLGETDSTEET